MPFGQNQDTELWNDQFPETKILGLPVSRHIRALVYLASRDEVDVDAFYKGIQYALEKLRKSKFGFERTAVSNKLLFLGHRSLIKKITQTAVINNVYHRIFFYMT